MFPLFAGRHEKCPEPWWDKEWNKPGTLKTKPFAIRDGNHALLQLCKALAGKPGKKRECEPAG
jgi:hypothetical protein